MRISFQTNSRIRWDFEFGYRNSMWQSIYGFSLIRVSLDEAGCVEYAEMRIAWFKARKFWNYPKSL